MGFEIVLGFCYQFDRSDQPDIQRIFHVPLSSRSQERNEDCNFSSSAASVACIQRNPLCDWKVGSADIRWKYRFPPARLSIFFSLPLPSHAPFSYQTSAPPLLAESYRRGSSVLGKKRDLLLLEKNDNGRLSLHLPAVRCELHPARCKRRSCCTTSL